MKKTETPTTGNQRQWYNRDNVTFMRYCIEKSCGYHLAPSTLHHRVGHERKEDFLRAPASQSSQETNQFEMGEKKRRRVLARPWCHFYSSDTRPRRKDPGLGGNRFKEDRPSPTPGPLTLTGASDQRL
ncbi:hypothetical protein ElyMa_003716500 [Elysia marginata]|uniref:C2H2-type domain-containing protein n=1 Tax=Elysia marginata TaxID=1093978 RepID=A0AAV4F557_9GAST|nr:hypothetical protein ElyMa_003716500 [Elysia marginata]